MNQHPLTNTGFKSPPLRLNFKRQAHHIMGLTAPLWQSFLPTQEEQKIGGKETNACMTYSSTNVLETQLDYLLSIGQIPAQTLLWCSQQGYLDTDNHFNFSDRFSAIMNGTTPSEGNSFDPVWNGYQQYGLLPEKDFTYTNEKAQQFLTVSAFWADYYDRSQITGAMLDKAKQFLSYFECRWHYELTDGANAITKSIYDFFTGNKGTQLSILSDSLRAAPVHIGLYPCPTWNSGNVLYCGNDRAAHGVMLYGISPDNKYLVLDQYNPANKTLSADYVIPYAVLATIRPLAKLVHVFNINLKQGDKSDEIVWLQKALCYLGYMKTAPTGFFGPLTAQALLSFQVDKGITPVSESNFGPKSRAAMSLLFSH